MSLEHSQMDSFLKTLVLAVRTRNVIQWYNNVRDDWLLQVVMISPWSLRRCKTRL